MTYNLLCSSVSDSDQLLNSLFSLEHTLLYDARVIQMKTVILLVYTAYSSMGTLVGSLVRGPGLVWFSARLPGFKGLNHHTFI